MSSRWIPLVAALLLLPWAFAPDLALGRRVQARLERVVAPEVPPSPAATPEDPLHLQTLAPGFTYGRLHLPATPRAGDATARFVRVDPARVRVEVRSAALGDGRPRTARAWVAGDDRRAVAVLNASMYADDGQTSIGYLRVRGAVQNGGWAAQQNSLLATDPAGPGVATLYNLGCADRGAVDRAFTTLVQSIRMLGCHGENLWQVDEKAWSAALVGTDTEGRILLIHVRAAYTMHTLVDLLRAAPLGLTGLHYADGGPPASLYVRGPGFEEEDVGSYESGQEEHDGLHDAWQIPNVVVVGA